MSDEVKKTMRDGWQNFLTEQSKIENQYEIKIKRIGEYVTSIGVILPETFEDYIRWYFKKYPDLKYWETFPNVLDVHLQEYSETRKDELYKIFKAPKENTPKITRAGIGLAIVYLEKHGGLRKQKYKIKDYVDRYASSLKNVLAEYERFANCSQKNLFFHDITENKNSINARKQVAEQVFYILQDKGNKQAETQAQSDFEAFLKHYKYI